ncbi:MAG: HTH domain-containing protein, partial [Eubacterium sp.]
MISSRMLSILQFMKIHKVTSYKEIAENLQLKERSIRYDIERINDTLSMENQPTIEKQSKGRLIFPDAISIESLTGTDTFIYSSEERQSLLLLILLIRNEDFKINQICHQFQVSRSTIKNDVSELEELLAKEDLYLEYTNHFALIGPKAKRVTLLNNEFKKY